MRRVIWIILDSAGMGEAPDAAAFGDVGSSTIPHTWEYNNGLNIPNLLKMGLGNIDGMKSLPVMDEGEITGAYGRSSEKSAGKDTTVGHWEMTGVISDKPFPTYPDGFPDRIINEFIKETGVPGVLGNCVASGTEIMNAPVSRLYIHPPTVFFRLRLMLTASCSTVCMICVPRQERYSPGMMR